MKNIFSASAPLNDGRIKVTLEYDALFVRNMAKNFRDALYNIPEMMDMVRRIMEEIEGGKNSK